MSTVPEVIAAVHGGMEVLGLAVITDMAIPETLEKPEHHNIVEVAGRAGKRLSELILAILPEL